MGMPDVINELGPTDFIKVAFQKPIVVVKVGLLASAINLELARDPITEVIKIYFLT